MRAGWREDAAVVVVIVDVDVGVRERARKRVASCVFEVSHVSVGAFAIGSCAPAVDHVKALSHLTPLPLNGIHRILMHHSRCRYPSQVGDMSYISAVRITQNSTNVVDITTGYQFCRGEMTTLSGAAINGSNVYAAGNAREIMEIVL